MNRGDQIKIGFKHLSISFYYFDSMYETGKQAQVIRKMRAYKLHLLGISECRWTGCGKKNKYRRNNYILSITLTVYYKLTESQLV
jgi:hypothetical protein